MMTTHKCLFNFAGPVYPDILNHGPLLMWVYVDNLLPNICQWFYTLRMCLVRLAWEHTITWTVLSALAHTSDDQSFRV